MVSTATDFEQSGLDKRAVGAQAPLEFENEREDFNDSKSSGEEKPGKVWRPEDA